jgi:hypothetical protein
VTANGDRPSRWGNVLAKKYLQRLIGGFTIGNMEKERRSLFSREEPAILIGSRGWVEGVSDWGFRKPADTDLIMTWTQFKEFIKEYKDYIRTFHEVRAANTFYIFAPFPITHFLFRLQTM